MPEDTGQKVGRAKTRPFSCAGLIEQGTSRSVSGEAGGSWAEHGHSSWPDHWTANPWGLEAKSSLLQDQGVGGLLQV